jgi:hypothetical protein
MIRKRMLAAFSAVAAVATIVATSAATAGAAPGSAHDVAKTTIPGTVPATTGPATVPATTVPAEAVPAGFVRVTDDTGRISIVVPAQWTDLELGPAMSNVGLERPKIVAAPDIDAMNAAWTTPGVWFGLVPAPADPSAWLQAYGSASQCAQGGAEAFDNGQFAGVKQTWVNCGGGTAARIQLAGRSADGSVGIYLQLQAVSADDPAIATVLSSVGLVAGSSAPVPATVDSATVSTIGPADASINGAADPSARRVVDSTGRLAMSVLPTFLDLDVSAALNDDASPRPSISSAPDLAAHYAQWTAAGIQVAVLPYIDPATLLVNRTFAGCTDEGIRPFSNGRLNGFVRTWSGCGGTATRVVQVTMSPSDASATVFLYAQLPDADNTALVTALATLELL